MQFAVELEYFMNTSIHNKARYEVIDPLPYKHLVVIEILAKRVVFFL
jgi:hypothetical protein